MQNERDWIIHLALFSLLFFLVFELPSELLTLLIAIVVGAMAIGAIVIRHYNAWSRPYQDIIRQEIKQLGGRWITIFKEVAEKDTNTCTYLVKFVSPSGKRFQTKCIIRKYDSKLYWSQSPIELLRGSGRDTIAVEVFDNLQQIHSDDNRSDSGQRSQKEILLDKLTSTFKHERRAAVAQIAEMSQVDELIIHRLQEMAVSEPDPQVRDAANRTLAILGRESL